MKRADRRPLFLTRPQTRLLVRLVSQAILECPDEARARRSALRALLRKIPAGHGWSPHTRQWRAWAALACASEPEQAGARALGRDDRGSSDERAEAPALSKGAT